MTRKPPLTCCCPQQQQVSGGGFHICLALQLLENQNRLHIIFDEKISVLHAHVNVPGKTSEVRRALKRSLRSKSSTLRADVSNYRPEVYKSEKTKILKINK